MKRDKIVYWTTTGIVCFVMAFSVVNFNVKNPVGPEVYKVEGAFQHLKLPDYMRIELTIAKTLGLLALLIPAVPPRIKEFAYFGFCITLLSASFAHFSVGDPFLFIIDPLFFLSALVVSYIYYHKLRAIRDAH